jgi:hypothetical protein
LLPVRLPIRWSPRPRLALSPRRARPWLLCRQQLSWSSQRLFQFLLKFHPAPLNRRKLPSRQQLRPSARLRPPVQFQFPQLPSRQMNQ